MSEVKCSTCKGVGRLEFEQGQRRVPCVTCSGSGIDWRKTCDALDKDNTRLTKVADDALDRADAQRLRADTAEGALEVANRTLGMFADDLQVAEQRIAELLDLLRDINDAPGGSQFRKSIEAALNPNPEAESHGS